MSLETKIDAWNYYFWLKNNTSVGKNVFVETDDTKSSLQ